jgi:hypothetical protein
VQVENVKKQTLRNQEITLYNTYVQGLQPGAFEEEEEEEEERRI